MRKSTKFIAAAGVAGLALAGSIAFTGAGLSTSGSAASDQFVGGTVSQAVTGATLTDLVYGFADSTNTAVHTVTLTFADATGGKTPTITVAGSASATFTCTAIDGTTFVSTCTADTVDQTDVTSTSVTVS